MVLSPTLSLIQASLAADGKHVHGVKRPDPMNPVYFETRSRSSDPLPEWPQEFVIVSAYATTGESWTPHENEMADCHLASELVTRVGWLVRIVGYSPLSGHSEPSWAVELPLAEARDIGQRFRQEAIYHVRNDELSVTSCSDQSAFVRIGSFRDRLDAAHHREFRHGQG